MDGNGRWAKKRHLPRTAGHKKGVDATRKAVEYCSNAGVEVLTVFAFSSENWQRPEGEVSTLMELFFSSLRREAKRMKEQNIRMRIIGDRSRFPEKLQREMAATEAVTEECTGLLFQIAANYGGRADLMFAMRRIGQKLLDGTLAVEEIDEAVISDHTFTAGLPDPDLFIRTGGEKRISNFLLWQIAYAELYFSDVLWPDFDDRCLDEAFADFAARERRFGKTSEQVRHA